jgi:enterochelin esterase-like enzyme
VYTPPGYESRRGAGLPVLVLLPGTPGTEADWVTAGLVNRIVDNLIAQRWVVVTHATRRRAPEGRLRFAIAP